jgi:hypothetical protein
MFFPGKMHRDATDGFISSERFKEIGMARSWWKRLLITVIGGPLLVFGCDRIQMMDWVGSADLEVRFAICDAIAEMPIPGAQIEVRSEGGFYEEQDKQVFVLTAGPDGLAKKECRSSMCFGTASGLGFTNTFVVHLPWWRFRVVAHGYHPGEWTELDVPEYIRQAKRVGPSKARLVVQVKLHKMPAE